MLSSTFIDEDGLYDPSHFNDRLLLGLKGTMSEAELHVLKSRLIGGILNKARRGELRLPLPVGLIYDQDDKVMLDPDQQVQRTLRHFFGTFERTRSAWATMQSFRKQGLKFPKRGQAGSGDIVWQHLTEAVALETLHNPRYAGAYCFGRSRNWKDAEGKCHSRELPWDQWRVLIQSAHPGYIQWEQFLANQAQLLKNHQAVASEQSHGTPREGPALLQGLVICGRCGRTMTVRYHHRKGYLIPEYLCQRESVEAAGAVCQRIPGGTLDEATGQLLMESVSPLALEVSFQVHAEIQAQIDETSRLRQQHVQRAQYEADKAQLRFMKVDPNNRLVADTLESAWNEKLRWLAQAKEELEKQRQADAVKLTAQEKARVNALVSDFPKLWKDPKTQDRDRKRMARMLLSDVTLNRGEDILAQIRFRGGALREIHVPLPKMSWEIKKTKPEIVREIDRLLDHHTEAETVQILNEQQWHSSAGNPFSLRIVNWLRRAYRLKPRIARLQEQGLLTTRQVGPLIGTVSSRVKHWRQAGLLKGVKVSEKNEYLYHKPNQNEIEQIQHRRGKRGSNAHRVESHV